MFAVIEEIRNLRRSVSQTLADVIASNDSNNLDEHRITKLWHEQLQQLPDITAEGWYMPPPHGIILAISAPPDYARTNRGTFRPAESWPNDTRHLSDNSLLFAYASPVQKQSGLIGDLACSLYRGNDNELKKHLANVWNVTMSITELACPGMSFASLYRQAMSVVDSAGLKNIVDSVHGGSTTDIGHSIPWFTEPPSPKEREILEIGSAQQVADLVSGKRIFVNETNDRIIEASAAFTIEPRLIAPGLPMANFHVIVGFDNGNKHVVTEFDPLFELFEMETFHA